MSRPSSCEHQAVRTELTDNTSFATVDATSGFQGKRAGSMRSSMSYVLQVAESILRLSDHPSNVR